MNRGGAQRWRSRYVALPGKDRVVEHRKESEAPDFLDAAVEFVAIERAGRRHDGQPVAWLESPRLEHHRKRDISSAIARCSSRPSADRSARAAGGPGATAPAGNRSLPRRVRLHAA